TTSLISTIANDGVYTPPRIVAGELLPDSKALPVVFHPAQQHRVVSTMTAAQMKKMMEGVVLFGTARRAILDGYTVAGKTGTAQKVDPQTGVYSKTKYVASFIGFSPVNSPAITIAVILDSPAGLHQGGQVCAPVFKRIAQQVLEYLHVPHDLDVKNPQRQQLMASAKDNDVDESSDHLGAPVPQEETAAASSVTATAKPAAEAPAAPSATAAALETKPSTAEATIAQAAPPSQPPPAQSPPNGTVILDVDSGVVVPSFLGKPLRSAVEIAQQSGLEINALGSGIAREQWPAPGSRLPSGQHITVRFAH
ncbi:MAG: penicillin-binding transpeptidase domain-containing protein, partial [Candidatus Korobacteraceae bacterium]